MYVHQALSPVLVVLREHRPLMPYPEAYHNPAAVWWGAFAASAVIRDQVLTVKPQGRGLAPLETGCTGNPCRVPRRQQGGQERGAAEPIDAGPGAARPLVCSALMAGGQGWSLCR